VSKWLVERTSSLLARRGTTRRSFLVRTAVVGSAVAVAPWQYLLRPDPAYAVVCGECGGGPCCDGWTEFCCVINGGRNKCPPGSFAGGWWKADGSVFCSGPRYFIDCMEHCTCASGGPFCPGCIQSFCGCPSCSNRRVYCNYFRYGQCHTEIGSSGPIACRVVTCKPPWEKDPSCQPVTAVDNATANHTANCPPKPPKPEKPFKIKEDPPVFTTVFNGEIHAFYVTSGGILRHKWGGGERWHTNIVAEGCDPARPQVSVENLKGFGLHVFAASAEGQKMIYASFDGRRWRSRLV
jgi:hypothetical protein